MNARCPCGWGAHGDPAHISAVAAIHAGHCDLPDAAGASGDWGPETEGNGHGPNLATDDHVVVPLVASGPHNVEAPRGSIPGGS